MCVGIHRLFLCKFSLCWGALPPHSLACVRVVVLEQKLLRGPTNLVNVRGIRWLFRGQFFPRWGALPPHSLASAPAVGHGPMSLRGVTNPANVRGHSSALPL